MAVNADDFGISSCVSKGIADLLNKQKLDTFSVMVVCISHEDNDRLSGLCVDGLSSKAGLHLTLTGKFKAETGCSSITDKNGVFFTPLQLVLRAITGRIKRSDLEKEIKAQIKSFCNLFGSTPNHIDSHHYIHQLPFVSGILIKALVDIEYDGYVRNCSTKPVSAMLISPSCSFKLLFLHFFGVRLKKNLCKNNLVTNRFFFGIYPFKKTNRFLSYFKRFLFVANFDKDIIVVHPALFISQDLREKDSLLDERVYEYKVLSES